MLQPSCVRKVSRSFGVGACSKGALAGAIRTAVAEAVAGGIIAQGVGRILLLGWLLDSGIMVAKAKAIGDATIHCFKEEQPTTRLGRPLSS